MNCDSRDSVESENVYSTQDTDIMSVWIHRPMDLGLELRRLHFIVYLRMRYFCRYLLEWNQFCDIIVD